MKTKMFLFGLTLLMTCFETATAQERSPVTIQEITTNGEACPEGTASITLAPDNRSFSILFDQAYAGSSADVPVENKVCELTIVSHVPAGWKFNFHSFDYRGFSQVDPGSKTFARTSYYRLTQKNDLVLFKRSKKNFLPGFADNYNIHHETNIKQPNALRCTDHLEVIKVQLQLVAKSNPKKITSAQIVLDSADGAVEGTKEICY